MVSLFSSTHTHTQYRHKRKVIVCTYIYYIIITMIIACKRKKRHRYIPTCPLARNPFSGAHTKIDKSGESMYMTVQPSEHKLLGTVWVPLHTSLYVIVSTEKKYEIAMNFGKRFFSMWPHYIILSSFKSVKK